MSTPDPVRRLIIVDDEPVILQLLTTIFRPLGLDLVSCPDGTSALRAMESGVGVLLTDKNLPDVGGLELVRRAREVSPDCECIVLTGFASLDTALQAMELDVFDYIVKPPKDIFDVRRKVMQAFEKREMKRENARLLGELMSQHDDLQASHVELQRAQEELIQSEKLAGIGTLAAGVAHEISSPLFGIMGLAEAISEEDDLASAQAYGRDIVEYSRSIKEIVMALTGYTRTAEREYLTTVDLRQVIEDAVTLVGRSLSCDLKLPVNVENGLYVHARTNELQQVFVNLVKNAVEAVSSDEHGAVHVEAVRENGYVVVRVIDNGPGISEDRRPMVFDPFYTTKPPGQGTGLGLNIVYRIVTKYRGTVQVVETPTGGATFQIRFPVDTEN